jgi:ERCC4-type nuclease
MIQCVNPANEPILIFLQKQEVKMRQQNQQNRMYAFLRAGKSVKAATHVLRDGADCAKLHGIGAHLSSQIELGVFGACERLSQNDSRSRGSGSSSNDPNVAAALAGSIVTQPASQQIQCSFRKGKMVWSVLALMGIHHETTKALSGARGTQDVPTAITCEEISARLIIFQELSVLTCALTRSSVLSALRTLQKRKLVETIDNEIALQSMLSYSTNGAAHIPAPKLRWVFTAEGLAMATGGVLPNLDEREVIVEKYKRALPATTDMRSSGSQSATQARVSRATFEPATAAETQMRPPVRRSSSANRSSSGGSSHAVIDLLDDDDDEEEEGGTNGGGTNVSPRRVNSETAKRRRMDASLPTQSSNATTVRSQGHTHATQQPPPQPAVDDDLDDLVVTPVRTPKAWTLAQAQFEKFGRTPFDTQRGQSAYNVTSPLRRGEWEAVLLLDTREVFGHGQGKSLLHSRLMDQRINTEVRPLPLGDMLWVIRRFDAISGKHIEYVHDLIVERKGQHDLCSSIKDGRWKEQKRRLTLSGLKKVVYVIEGTWTINDNMPLTAFNKALAQCCAHDEFMVRCTADVSDTVAFLGAVHAMVRASTTHNPNWHGPERDKWCTYSQFKAACGKKLAPTLGDMFGMQLKQVDRLGTISALMLVEQFGTPAGLVRVLKAMRKQEALHMLAGLSQDGGRAIGPKLAAELYGLYGPG